MRREIFVFLIVCSLTFAALDQSYIQTVSRTGASEIVKSMDITVFAAEFGDDAFEKLQNVCETDPEFVCSVEDKTIIMTESFSSGTHYSFEADYGLPSITYTMTIKKIPTDAFSMSLDRLLRKAEVISGPEGGSVIPIDLEKDNTDDAALLRMLNANITYVLNMPVEITEASAGTVSGSSVTFDVVGLMEESEPVVVKSTELNIGYLIAIAAVLVLAALAVMFFTRKK